MNIRFIVCMAFVCMIFHRTNAHSECDCTGLDMNECDKACVVVDLSPTPPCDAFDLSLITRISVSGKDAIVVYDGERLMGMPSGCNSMDVRSYLELPEKCSIMFTPTGCKYIHVCELKGCAIAEYGVNWE
jgi:hypothetical protein